MKLFLLKLTCYSILHSILKSIKDETCERRNTWITITRRRRREEEKEERRCKYSKEYKNDDDSDSDSSITQELFERLQDDDIWRETYHRMIPLFSLTTPIFPLPPQSSWSTTNPFNCRTTRPSTILSSSITIRPSTTTNTTPTALTISFITQIRTSTLENENQRNWIGWFTVLIASCTNIWIVLFSPSCLQYHFTFFLFYGLTFSI